MNDEPDLDAARARLDAQRAELEGLSQATAGSRAPVALDQQSVGRLSRMDAMQRQAMDQALDTRRRRDLTRIEAAERRLRDGEYGWCEECGESIPDGRLAIDPMAERCVGCAR